MFTLHEKLLAVQAELKAPKDHKSPMGYTYRSCEDILEAVKPLLKAQNLVLTLSDSIELIGTRFYVKATATLLGPPDAEGDVPSLVCSAYAREEEEKKGTDAAKITGAASSYARKYALNGLFCIDDTKDADAEQPKAVSPAKATAPVKQPTQAQKTMQNAPAKPASAKPEPTPTLVNEWLTASKDLKQLQTMYEKAFKRHWTKEQAADITECYLNVYARIQGLVVTTDRTHLATKEGEARYAVSLDPAGKATVTPFSLPVLPETVDIAEQAQDVFPPATPATDA